MSARGSPRTALRWVLRWLGLVGVDPLRPRYLPNLPRFLRELARYRRANQREAFRVRFPELFPVLSDYDAAAATHDRHYFRQDLWAARRIFASRPAVHVDVGSRIDGFVAHLLVFMDVKVIDVRPLKSDVPGLTFVESDATRLAAFEDSSLKSLSSLHAVEHFGLGRYGDPVDPEACFTFMCALQRVLAPGGRLYFATPVGRERVEFNAHRVFQPTTILDTFAGLELLSFSAVDDAGLFHESARPEDYVNAEFSCGMFEFTNS